MTKPIADQITEAIETNQKIKNQLSIIGKQFQSIEDALFLEGGQTVKMSEAWKKFKDQFEFVNKVTYEHSQTLTDNHVELRNLRGGST